MAKFDRLTWPFKFEIVSMDDMFVDRQYQRPLSTFYKQIVKRFDPALLTTLLLSLRDTGPTAGRYAIMDGQTRFSACEVLVKEKRYQIDGLPALVYSGLSRAQEAALFAQIQTQRKSVRPYHRFRADLVAGDKQAKAINKIVNDIGFKLADTADANKISAIVSLEKVFKKDPRLLRRSLRVIYNAWTHSDNPAPGEMVKGIAYFLSNNKVDDEVLINELTMTTPEDVRTRATQMRKTGAGQGGGSPQYVAMVLAAIYGRALSETSDTN